jgi:hypothetical protein
MKLQTMTIDEWEEKYKPIPNHLVPDRETAFETYGPEWDFVKVQDPRRIWTEIQGDDGNLYITNGCHWVNRLQYYVTQIPCEPEFEFEILSWEFSKVREDEL